MHIECKILLSFSCQNKHSWYVCVIHGRMLQHEGSRFNLTLPIEGRQFDLVRTGLCAHPKVCRDGESMPQNEHFHIPGKGLNVFLLERLDLLRSRIRILFHMNRRTNCPV